MTAKLQHITSNPLTRIGAIVGVVVVGALVALTVVLVTSGSDPQASAPSGGKGAGGDPPPHLLEVYNSLPFPPGLTTREDPVSTGVELMAFHWAADQPDQILGFYNRELVAAGWQRAELPTSQASDAQPGPTHPASTNQAYVKDDLRLIIAVAANTKAPQYGPSQLGITIEPR